MRAKILLTGSREDEFVQLVNPDFYEQTYTKLIEKIGGGEMHIFPKGGHPAILSNQEDFVKIAKKFLT